MCFTRRASPNEAMRSYVGRNQLAPVRSTLRVGPRILLWRVSPLQTLLVWIERQAHDSVLVFAPARPVEVVFSPTTQRCDLPIPIYVQD